jgi:hypothetical protein
MNLHTKLVVILSLGLFIQACQPQQDNQSLSALIEARDNGDLSGQLTALNTLLQTADAQQTQDYNQQIATIEKVKKLNNDAQNLLQQQSFDALEIAMKADKMRYNQTSRQMIKTVLTPYRDFTPLYRDIREWAYPLITVVIAPESIPERAGVWFDAMNSPTLWPDSNLIELLRKNPAKMMRILSPIINERKKLAKIVRQLKRFSDKSPDDTMMLAIYQDAQTINVMYNTLLTDYQWFYLKKGLQELIKANKELIEVANDATYDEISKQQWLIDYLLSAGIHQDKIRFCCTYYSQQIEESFPFLEQPAQFETAVKALHKTFAELVKSNLTPSNSSAEAITFSTAQNQRFAKIIENIDPLATSIDRKKVSSAYLRAVYGWQQNSFYELETLLPHLKTYKTTLRGY